MKLNKIKEKILKKRFKRQSEIIEELIKKGIPTIDAIIRAGDLAHAEDIEERIKAGVIPVEQGIWLVGSYARFDIAFKYLPKAKFFEMLPSLWTGSDPKDNVLMLGIWKEAKERNQGLIIDNRVLPNKKVFPIYRGQLGDELGISWSLDKEVAKKFSKTGGGRTLVKGGKIISAFCYKQDILAYLTGRSEEEIIIDPKNIWTKSK
jgi:hypothetical protein